MSIRKDYTNQPFGKLTALFHAWPNRRGPATWLCACDCGKLAFVTIHCLVRGYTRGCIDCDPPAILKWKIDRTAHGAAKTPEYWAFKGARGRCTNPNNPCYHDYGGRGIEFRFTKFQDFLDEVGPRPSPKHSLDRINNDGHYEKGNLRWATKKHQANNRRSYHETLLNRIAELEAQLAAK